MCEGKHFTCLHCGSPFRAETITAHPKHCPDCRKFVKAEGRRRKQERERERARRFSANVYAEGKMPPELCWWYLLLKMMGTCKERECWDCMIRDYCVINRGTLRFDTPRGRC